MRCVCVASGVTLDSVYKSLNRTVLYLLSRPVHSVTDQMALLDALHRLTSHRSLILGPGNFDQQFIGCLCYCLIQLTDNCPENIRSVSQSTTLSAPLNISQSVPVGQLSVCGNSSQRIGCFVL